MRDFKLGDFVRDEHGRGDLYKIVYVCNTHIIVKRTSSRNTIKVEIDRARSIACLDKICNTPLWKVLNG